MSIFSGMFAKRDPREKIEHLAHLRLKLQEVKSGRHLLKPSDGAPNLASLEEKLVNEITRLERSPN